MMVVGGDDMDFVVSNDDQEIIQVVVNVLLSYGVLYQGEQVFELFLVQFDFGGLFGSFGNLWEIFWWQCLQVEVIFVSFEL